MPVFYRGPCARITDEALEVDYPDSHRFLIRELSQVWQVRNATRAPAGVSSARLVVRCTGAAGAAALAVVTGGPLPDHLTGNLLALVLLGTSVTVSAWYPRSRATSHELWAIYRGHLVRLFSTPDARVFGQVKRALCRAIEYRDARSA